ncbi:FkbM family methyltransferase [Flavobacterium luminosum]|uniref:FkbM family methyltransferase n=1 Tax=Flavobacterium luminosum TaxID=2949086 RepID=A0ABT0TNZ8_9FLAO|nr:FkbM family methyltransferase [Flavobacterium sp. HXWNR70]MCL9809207.1 FkbM family methyltransferase [Flavobacterium sp. HXWNR70]
MLNILIRWAYRYWPALYKKRYYKTLGSLTTGNYKCEPELLYIHQVLKDDSVFVDIGTNKGIYLYQAEKVIQNGAIFGFEPNQSLVDYIKPLFPKVKLFPLAVSSNTGTSVLHIPKKGNGLQDTRASLEEMGEGVEKIEIRTITLDDWAKQENITKIDLVKIDVEGHEFDSIKGCEQILKTLKPIFIIEIELRHANYPIHEIFDFITGFGYDVFYFDRKTLYLKPFEVSQMAEFQKDEYLNDFNKYINNFIFIPR